MSSLITNSVIPACSASSPASTSKMRAPEGDHLRRQVASGSARRARSGHDGTQPSMSRKGVVVRVVQT